VIGIEGRVRGRQAPGPFSFFLLVLSRIEALGAPLGESVCAAIKAIYHLVIAYVAFFIFALVGHLLTVVLPWFVGAVLPMAWP